MNPWWQQLALLILFSLKSRNIPQPSLCSPMSRGSKHRLSVFTFSFKYGISKFLKGEVVYTCIIFQVVTVSEQDMAMQLLIKRFQANICPLCVSDIRISAWFLCGLMLNHTSYLSRKPREFSWKFFLAGVNFYRFNAKNWQFTVYFAVITQKIGNFLCILS